ncbi:membrane progestin receptor beta-like [Sphaeramia orbicularis]|uniref:membrane progestin receptor beta-like n=1 Tax=Sphaeramia orbicularis TaxID=375764 RepID=UPI00117BE553|nr:membrane progestin receptor beta-like [Sphaeramia orbicularis]
MPWVSFAAPSLALPSLPATVRDVDVPPLFREPFILSGYRPVGLSRRFYVLSLFQMHNQTLSTWSPLLAAACITTRFLLFTVLQGGGVLGVRLQGPEGQGVSVDVSSTPLVLYLLSALTYLSCSGAAQLLQSESEDTHYLLSFLVYVSMAIYQYGAALALCLYSSDAAWAQSMLGQVFLPLAFILAWSCCATCCFTKLHFRRLYLPQAISVGVAYLLDINPVVHRLSNCGLTGSPAVPLHVLQVVLFLLASFFSLFPVPECFCPGRFDVIGHSCQLSLLLRSLWTLVQQEALFSDFLWRRQALVRRFGEERLLVACTSFPCLVMCCVMTAFSMRRRNHTWMMKEQR